MTETCTNCGEKIGALEPAMLFRESVVCYACHRKLTDIYSKSPAEKVRDVYHSPALASPLNVADAQRNIAAGAVLFRVIFWIVAGIIILSLLSQIAKYRY